MDDARTELLSLISNLLELSDASPHLSEAKLERLRQLAAEVQPDVESLSRVSNQVGMTLLSVPGLRSVNSSLITWRVENFEYPHGETGNPFVPPAGSIEELTTVTRQALADPGRLTHLIDQLRRLTEKMGLPWPGPPQQ